MAISLLYRKTSHTETLVEYEVLHDPDDPNETPMRLRLSVQGDATPHSDSPMTMGLRAAARTIMHRKATEGSWPNGGLIRS